MAQVEAEPVFATGQSVRLELRTGPDYQRRPSLTVDEDGHYPGVQDHRLWLSPRASSVLGNNRVIHFRYS
jgi:hypothetical protein